MEGFPAWTATDCKDIGCFVSQSFALVTLKGAGSKVRADPVEKDWYVN
jgi:hypothetical protein